MNQEVDKISKSIGKPSAHTAIIFNTATILGDAYPVLKWPLYGLGVFVGLEKVFSRKHTIWDVLLAAGIGFIGAKAWQLFYKIFDMEE